MSVLKAKFYPDSVNHTQITWMVSSCSYNMIIASGHLRLFVENFSNFDSVQTVSILSGRFKYCPDGFNTVRTVSILSRRFQYCPDGFNTFRTVSILSQEVSKCIMYCCERHLRSLSVRRERELRACCICREKGNHALRPEDFCA